MAGYICMATPTIIQPTQWGREGFSMGEKRRTCWSSFDDPLIQCNYTSLIHCAELPGARACAHIDKSLQAISQRKPTDDELWRHRIASSVGQIKREGRKERKMAFLLFFRSLFTVRIYLASRKPGNGNLPGKKSPGEDLVRHTNK